MFEGTDEFKSAGWLSQLDWSNGIRIDAVKNDTNRGVCKFKDDWTLLGAEKGGNFVKSHVCTTIGNFTKGFQVKRSNTKTNNGIVALTEPPFSCLFAMFVKQYTIKKRKISINMIPFMIRPNFQKRIKNQQRD